MAFVAVRGLRKTFGPQIAVDGVSFDVEKGALVTLLGPSGCGKTTTLRCLAGLERPDAGDIEIDGRSVCSSAQGIFVPPEGRNLGMVFQSYAVWPHLTVAQNVAFPLRVRRLDRAETHRRVRAALARVGLEGLEGRPVTRLSGGQQQRVALARALVYDPSLLLFDEPLSNLDARLRERMRLELKRVQREVGVTSIYVTHDQAEALALSDRIAILQAGRIEQEGTPQDIYARPASRFVAEFVGHTNLRPGRVVASAGGGRGCAAFDDGGAMREVAGALSAGAAAGETATVLLPRQALALAPRPGLVALSPGTIAGTMFQGDFLDLQVQVGAAEYRLQVAPGTGVRPGQEVVLYVDPAQVFILPD